MGCEHKWRVFQDRQIVGYRHIWQQCEKCLEIKHTTDAPAQQEQRDSSDDINTYGY